ncbi:MAG: hypothetical protein A3F11_01740 [Gammaproteobacteria bacterium RIFCSPHIGHO2_12_FULL_37_14]|nr:MAG: hypothetical protein A3F11_01740 [Gammaproteobacteria bacterium RIFCSPHIGHO2_12_FULL_37_14]
MVNLFVQSWKGEAPLWKAFWIVYFVMGYVVMFTVITILIFPTVIDVFSQMQQMKLDGYSFQEIHAYSYNTMYQEGIANLPLFTAIVLPYKIFCAISIWRCSKNSLMIWKVLAILVVGLGLLKSFGTILWTLMS